MLQLACIPWFFPPKNIPQPLCNRLGILQGKFELSIVPCQTVQTPIGAPIFGTCQLSEAALMKSFDRHSRAKSPAI